jgi:hypothetical protein
MIAISFTGQAVGRVDSRLARRESTVKQERAHVARMKHA